MQKDYKIFYLNFNINPNLLPKTRDGLNRAYMKPETVTKKRYTLKILPELVNIKPNWTDKAIGKVAFMMINNLFEEIEPKQFLNYPTLMTKLNQLTWDIYNYLEQINPTSEEIKLYENMDVSGNLINPICNIGGLK